jgi:hypothetical protein
MPIVLAGSTSGSTTIQATDAVTQTITLPAQTGTVMVNGPAFSAYNSGTQSVSNSTETKATLDTKEYDTGTCFNNTGSTTTLNGLSVPSYSFCPNIAGYYQVSGLIRYGTSSITQAWFLIYKNGSPYIRIHEQVVGVVSTGTYNASGSCLIYLNGTGDYISLYGYVTATTPIFANAGTPYTSRMQASLVRGA